VVVVDAGTVVVVVGSVVVGAGAVEVVDGDDLVVLVVDVGPG
jgi:hypothetical protein